MDRHLVFAISREYGSGGREIGERLAEELGIAYYDKLLLKRIAEESGLDGDVVADFDEKPLRPLLLNPNSFFCGTDLEHPVASRIYRTEVDILRSIAEEGSCVIVGRCADFILQDRTDCLKVFVHADLKFRADRIVRVYGEREKSPEARLKEKDKRRAAYYRFYTDMNWGNAANYHIALDSGVIGIEKSAEIIESLS